MGLSSSPLDGETIVRARGTRSSIAATTTRTGLLVKAALDTHHYDTAIQVSDEECARLHVIPHLFHGDWNYTISPRR